MNSPDLNIDDPFIPASAVDPIHSNAGQTTRQRIDNETPDTPAQAEQHDTHHGQVDFNEARILADFVWMTSNSGKRYLRAKPAYIEHLKQAGPAIRDQYVLNLREGDVPQTYTKTYDDACALGNLQAIATSAAADVDSAVAERELADMFNAAAWKALTASSMLARAQGWAESLGDREAPDKLLQLIEQGESAALDAAFWFTRAFVAANSRDLTNWQTAVYDFAQYQGNNNAKFLGDPTRGRTNNTNANNASLALLSRLVPRRAKAA